MDDRSPASIPSPGRVFRTRFHASDTDGKTILVVTPTWRSLIPATALIVLEAQRPQPASVSVSLPIRGRRGQQNFKASVPSTSRRALGLIKAAPSAEWLQRHSHVNLS
jgi:hypothetical protein